MNFGEDLANDQDYEGTLMVRLDDKQCYYSLSKEEARPVVTGAVFCVAPKHIMKSNDGYTVILSSSIKIYVRNIILPSIKGKNQI